MPRIDAITDDNMEQHTGAGTVKFSAVKPENLGASQYTLVTICMDRSGSVRPFEDILIDILLKRIIKTCGRPSSEVSENLLIRVLTFGSDIEEVHGFKELHMIDADKYKQLNASGLTVLYDVVNNAVVATTEFAYYLIKKGYNVNGAVFIVTDGEDTDSTLTAVSVKESVNDALNGEKIESLNTILIGLKDKNLTNGSWENRISKKLNDFKKEADLTQYVDYGDATEESLAAMADFISQSVSSQVKSQGTGVAAPPVQPTVVKI